MNKNKKLGFWILIIVGIMLTAFFLAGQTMALIDYDLVVSLGLQDSSEAIGEVGVAFAKGFGFGDTVIYIPLLVLGIYGLCKGKKWGRPAMSGAMAITIYWPLVHLYMLFAAGDAINLTPDTQLTYYILLPLITLYGAGGMWYLYKMEK